MATLEDVHVFVSDEQQTAVVTNGVNIRLDWSRWVNETLTGSAANETFTFQRTQLNESGDSIEPVVEINNSSNLPSRTVVKLNREENEFYVEITCVIVAGQNDSERAVYTLEVCFTRQDGSEDCNSSNITVYGIEAPKPIGKKYIRIFKKIE